ncbi:MAG TPA: pyridoxal-phosphate dependent enzyme, partial [Nannocystis exedens]|nr:pyridoxal-phosphate dependent enzyme [Nannocystis exedens]
MTRSASSRRSPVASPGSGQKVRSAREQLMAELRAKRAVCVDSITELIGNTPLVRLHRIERDCPGVQLWAKCEFSNPAGSVKDRAALFIIRAAQKSGAIRPGMRLLDSTSGNTGIAY